MIYGDLKTVYDRVSGQWPEEVRAFPVPLLSVTKQLEDCVRTLEDQNTKNSRNSSKPPNQDVNRPVRRHGNEGIPMAEFTNNQAGRDLRMNKVGAKVSGGFRKLATAPAFMRIPPIIGTAVKQAVCPLQTLEWVFTKGNSQSMELINPGWLQNFFATVSDDLLQGCNQRYWEIIPGNRGSGQ